jgi:hypothetical protein
MSVQVSRRAKTHADRAGDPLDGLVNLFDLAIVLAVAFLLAALSSFKLTSLLGNQDVTVVTNPGTPQQTIIVKHGGQVQELHLTKEQAQGTGQRLGTVYRLSDGRLVYVPQK